MGVLVTACFKVFRAPCCGWSQIHSVSFCASSHSGFVMSERWGKNLTKYWTIPKSWHSCNIFGWWPDSTDICWVYTQTPSLLQHAI